MSEDRSQQEPSMEEILASIRKIIAEDGDAERRDSAPEAEEPEGESEADAGDDVLELTEESEEEPLELTDPVEEQTDEEPLAPLQDMEMPLPPPPPPPPSGVQEEEIELIAEDEESEPVSRPESKRESGILSSSTEKAGMAAFSELAGVLATSRSSHGITIEDLAKELLRPMLREWLDDNLPGLVEKLVRAEIQRMVDRADVE